MRVDVKLFASLRKKLPPDSGRPAGKGTVELPDAATLADLIHHLDIPLDLAQMVLVNGEQTREFSYTLADGDQVSIFPPVAGGVDVKTHQSLHKRKGWRALLHGICPAGTRSMGWGIASLLDRTSQSLFIIGSGLAAFAAGMYVQNHRIFPYEIIAAASKTATTLIQSHMEASRIKGLFGRDGKFVSIAPNNVKAQRFKFFASDALNDPILVPGGPGRFTEYCPGYVGCLAVEYADRGKVRHAYPYLPDEIEKKALVSFPYEQLPGFSFLHEAYITGISRYTNGDLLVVFQADGSFPFGYGVARINRDGLPIWYRRDYSHHQAHITYSDVALVPSLRIGEGLGSKLTRIRKRLLSGNNLDRKLYSYCSKPYFDFAQVIDGAGRLLKEVPVLDALLESPYAGVLQYTNPCDPIHLNFVHEVGEDTDEADGIEPGDLVVSLRNIHAFAILDRDTSRLKRLVRGGFFAQHNVMHLEGTKFLMFDNWGRDDTHGRPRLLMVDVAEGSETHIFPNDATPECLRNLSSRVAGGIAISPDNHRVIVTFSLEGQAVEVRLADGAVLTAFTAVHDVSQIDSLPEKRKTQAALYNLRSAIQYIGE